jgi:signal transduction histidine kinase/AraC-like DNA-binding protein/DNA-binding LacI/PurR family transcriptional regulator
MLQNNYPDPAQGAHEIRVGALLGPHDPFWVQVRDVIYKIVQQLGLTLVPLELFESIQVLEKMDPGGLIDELLAKDLDVLISQEIPIQVVHRILDSHIPIIYLSESQIRHPLFVSLHGLYEAAVIVGNFVVDKLKGHGRALCVGGLLEIGEDKGVSRIKGFCDTLNKRSDISVLHFPAYWSYDQSLPLVESVLRGFNTPFDAIFGISDSLALAARDAARNLGLLTAETVVVGINGDPLALAAIAEGSMSATVETSACDMARQSVDLACRAARKEALPGLYFHHPRLISKENVAEIALQKLVAIANIPTQLVGVNFQRETSRMRQLQVSAEINRRLGAVLDRKQLFKEITGLIQAHYGFDQVHFYTWREQEQLLVEDEVDCFPSRGKIVPACSGILGDAIQKREPVYIPDTYQSQRFPPDPLWPDTRTRVVLPVILGEKLVGLVDLHRKKPNLNVREEIFGLRALADYLGVVFRNAELFTEALHARQAAEQADQLKTRLLASVSHELRTPLNIILGYSQSALSDPNPYDIELPEALRHDLHYIYQSGEHLLRIINDLLDLSRAEIGELYLVPEVIDTSGFLEDVFKSVASHPPGEPGVVWNLKVPARLPVIQADLVRLRQIILNLLSNAAKFTNQGEICLGAQVEPPHLHIWVRDTGLGIPIEEQERIFEPFRTVNRASSRQREGIGLGLNITRRLVALHGGSMLLESQPGIGSTFHIYLPLPTLAGQPMLVEETNGRSAFVVISTGEVVPQEISNFCCANKLEMVFLHNDDKLDDLWRDLQPAGLAWDLSEANMYEWNIIQRLRTHNQFAHLPFVLFSREQDGDGGSAGLTNVLFKPFSNQSFLDYLDCLLPMANGGFVWIVDDDPQTREFYQRMVNDALPGHPLRLLENGRQALELIELEIPEFVILDLVMPEVDGFQVLKQLRSNQKTCRVPVMVISGKFFTYEDIEKLNYARVTLHAKSIFSTDEVIASLQKSFSGEKALNQPTSLVVKQILVYLQQNYSQSISRRELAQSVGVTENYLSQIFRLELGITPWDCLNRIRINKAKEYLLNSEQTVTKIACQVGFNDPAYFSRVFKKMVGVSPQAFRLR